MVYFGEDPATKPEDFFSIIVSFSSALAVSRQSMLSIMTNHHHHHHHHHHYVDATESAQGE
jgi:hypothetical protein